MKTRTADQVDFDYLKLSYDRRDKCDARNYEGTSTV